MNKKVLVAIGIALLLLATIGFTYAFFTATIEGEGTDTIVEAGTLSLVYKDGQEITLNQAVPGNSVTKTFTVTNTGTLIADYSIKLSELINSIENNELVFEGTCQSYENYETNKTIKDICADIESTSIIESSNAGDMLSLIHI